MLAATLVSVCALGAMLAPRAVAEDSKPADSKSVDPKPAKPEAPKTQDQLILTNGTTVKGKVIEENATSVTMLVEFPGMAPVKTTYQKTEIVQLKRDVAVAPSAAASGSTSAPETKKDKPKDLIKEKLPPTVTDEATAAKIMVLKLTGFIGKDVSPTPMTNLFKEIDKEFDDLDVSGHVKSEHREDHVVVFKVDASTPDNRGFDGFFAAEKLAPELEKQFEKGRRVVFWIEDAVGGAAFLPMISPEIYWMKKGRLRGNGDLDKFDIGDKMVNEKQISLRLGHAEGIPIKGGYGEAGVSVVRALARKQNWLVVRMEGGKPVILQREPKEEDLKDHNWVILKDNGEGKWKDDKKTEGNDFLVLEADWARNLGLSKGTCDTEEDLVFAFGFQRNYSIIEKPKSAKVLDGWKKEIENALDLIRQRPGPQGEPVGKLWQKFQDADVTGDYNRRRSARGIKISALQEVQSILRRYAEVFDPEGQQVSQLNVEIEKLKQEADADRRAQQRTGQ